MLILMIQMTTNEFHELKLLQSDCVDYYDNLDELRIAIEGAQIKGIVRNTPYKIPRLPGHCLWHMIKCIS